MMRFFIPFIFLFSSPIYAEVYLDSKTFLYTIFTESVPEPQLLWLKKDRRQIAQQILGHKVQGMRVRYWQVQQRSVWILDEIGKELPITTAVVIHNNKIEQVKVLEFRESRGWEVKHNFFTDQFKGVALTTDKKLSKNIDGISGATLSVRALKKIARLALYYHQVVQTKK